MNPTTSIFVDTSGWAAPVVAGTPNSDQMEAFSRTLVGSGRELVTTNYIIAELVPLLTIRTRMPRQAILQFVSQMRRTAYIVYVDEQIDAEAWALLEQYADKDWSLADAASFVVMRRLGITDAFTTDHHFAQAGFVRLPA